MPIKVACSCGQSFAAPDNLAGRTVKCPSCSQPLSIPAAAPQQQPAAAHASGGLADLLAEEGLAMKAGSGPRCPSCSAPMPPHGFICVHCGYNVQSGKKVLKANEGEDHAARDAQKMIAKARRELKETPQQFNASAMGAGANAYITTAILFVVTMIGLSVSAAVFYFMDKSMEELGPSAGGLMSLAFGTVLCCIGGIWILVLAFLESVIKGVLCLFCGPYFLFYLFAGFSNHKLPAVLWLLGSAMQIGGQLMIALGGE